MLQGFGQQMMTMNSHSTFDVDLWLSQLEKYKKKTCEMALKEWMFNNKYPPKPQEIVELCEMIIFAVKNPLYDYFKTVSLTANNFNCPEVHKWVWDGQLKYQKQVA